MLILPGPGLRQGLVHAGVHTTIYCNSKWQHKRPFIISLHIWLQQCVLISNFIYICNFSYADNGFEQVGSASSLNCFKKLQLMKPKNQVSSHFKWVFFLDSTNLCKNITSSLSQLAASYWQLIDLLSCMYHCKNNNRRVLYIETLHLLKQVKMHIYLFFMFISK